MSRRTLLRPLAVALALWSAPATAAVYSGTFHGIITGGPAAWFDAGTFDSQTYDLAGQAIDITWSADVEHGYTDGNGNFYPLYFDNRVQVVIPALAGVTGMADVRSRQTNNVDLFGSASYSGNAHAGSFFASGSQIFEYYEPDFTQLLAFSFAGATATPGSLTGSGTTDSHFYDGRSYEADYTLTFDLVSGSVTGAAIPEPRTWGLLALGFGAVGIMARRRTGHAAA